MVQNVLTVNDFDAMLDNYAGRQVSHAVVTRAISNMTGQETMSYGDARTLKAYFVRTSQAWDYEKAGFLEKGHAIMLSKYADGVVKNDKITVDGAVYTVREAYNVSGVFDSTGAGTAFVYTACNLFLDQ